MYKNIIAYSFRINSSFY